MQTTETPLINSRCMQYWC